MDDGYQDFNDLSPASASPSPYSPFIRSLAWIYKKSNSCALVLSVLFISRSIDITFETYFTENRMIWTWIITIIAILLMYFVVNILQQLIPPELIYVNIITESVLAQAQNNANESVKLKVVSINKVKTTKEDLL